MSPRICVSTATHGDQAAGLDGRDILEETGLQHQAAEARIGEHGLDHDHAGDQVVDLQQDHRERRDQGVA